MYAPPQHPSSPALLLLAAVLLASCTTSPPQISTVKSFVDETPAARDDAALTTGEHVFAGHVARPTLTSARRAYPILRCADAGQSGGTCVASAPPAIAKTPAILVFPTVATEAPGASANLHEPAGDVMDAPAGAPEPTAGSSAAAPRAVVIPAGGSITIDTPSTLEKLGTFVYPAPPLAERTIAYAPFEVPRRARLRFGIAIEEPAWSIDSAPVAFRILAQDDLGATRELYRRVLDPGRIRDDRGWIDEDVDLGDLQGRTVTLRFVSEPARPSDERPSLPVWGAPRLVAPAADEPRPSVVLISLDTLRAKSMSLYGNPRETTPRMAALAARGTLFDSAFTTFSNTLGAHMSMLTGLYPVRHRVGQPHGPTELSPRRALLAQVFQKAGYATGAFTEDALLDARFGFRRGFSTYYEKTAIEGRYGDAAETFERAREWARRRADEPFFLFVHTYQVHAPYAPPPEYRDLFTDQRAALGDSLLAYEQEIRNLDDLLASLIADLRELVPDRRLLLVVTADHGEEFGEHGLTSHVQLFDEVMHVPLLFVWPGKISAGVRVPDPVSLVDVVPTILGLVGLPSPNAIDGLDLHGLLTGDDGGLERDVVLGEYPKSPIVPEPVFVGRSADAKCLVDRTATREVCYDLRNDPAERSPLPPDGSPAFARPYQESTEYRARWLELERAEDESARRRGAALRKQITGETGGKEAAATGNGSRPPSNAIERKLRALGYVD